MIRLLPILLCALLAAGCGSGNTAFSPPVEQDKMGRILKEMITADAVVNQSGGPATARDTTLHLYYARILENEQITPTQFDEAWNWYLYHPEELEAVYDTLLEDLSTEVAQQAAGKHPALQRLPPSMQVPRVRQLVKEGLSAGRMKLKRAVGKAATQKDAPPNRFSH